MEINELKAQQKQALKNNDINKLTQINKQLFEIRQAQAKQREQEREQERDNRTAKKITTKNRLDKGQAVRRCNNGQKNQKRNIVK